jgi:hypothetical protein
LLFAAGAARAEERVVRAQGVAGIAKGERLGAARQRAVSSGIAQAVYQVVGETLPSLPPEEAADAGPRLFGGDARDYVTRFRVVEDRGAQPREYSPDPAVTHEYVVLVEASVDARAVRARLAEAGLLAPAGDGTVRRVALTLDDLPSYAAYEAIREALVDRLQAESAVPLEFSRGRAVLDVATRDDARQLLARLSALSLPGLRIEPGAADERSAQARVRLEGPAEP